MTDAVVAQGEHIGSQPQETPAPQLNETTLEIKHMTTARVFVIAAIVGLICAFGSVAAYDRYYAQKIVTVNMTQYLKDQSDLYFAGKITREQLLDNFDKFSQTVKTQPKNKVIILEDVVANGGEKLSAN